MSSNTASLQGVNLLIAMPCYQGQVLVETAKCVMNLRLALTEKGASSEYFNLSSESLIPRGRNASVAYFLSKGGTPDEGDKPFTHMIFIDADITFQPASVIQLLERNEPISGCAYPKKAYNWRGIANGALRSVDWKKVRESVTEGKSDKDIIQEQLDTMNESTIFLRSTDYVYNLKNPQTQVNNGWMEVGEIGTGFMLIRKDVITTLMGKYPHMKYTNDLPGYNAIHPNMKDNFYLFFDCRCEKHGDSQRYLSEDYAFCKLCASAGYKIWLNANATLRHTGNHTFSGNLLSTLSLTIGDKNKDAQQGTN